MLDPYYLSGRLLFFLLVVAVVVLIILKLIKKKLNWKKVILVTAAILVSITVIFELALTYYYPAFQQGFKEGFQSGFKSEFMKTCVSEPRLKEYCSCTADQLLATMSFDELSDFEESITKKPDMTLDQFPQKVQQAISTCSPQIKTQ